MSTTLEVTNHKCISSFKDIHLCVQEHKFISLNEDIHLYVQEHNSKKCPCGAWCRGWCTA